MYNSYDSTKYKLESEEFFNQLEQIREQTDQLNENLPNNDTNTIEDKVKDALNVNLIDIWVKKEIAEKKVYEMSKQMEIKDERIQRLDYENYLLKEKRK